MPHPSTRAEILEALESNARNVVEYFSGLPSTVFFDGNVDRWSPGHHLEHLTRSSLSVTRALRSGKLPLHASGRSRPYSEVRDAAAASVAATEKSKLLEMGRTVVLAPEVAPIDVVQSFAAASADLRHAAAEWSEEALDRHAIPHPLMGALTVREMLLFFVVHERHHLKLVRTRVEGST